MTFSIDMFYLFLITNMFKIYNSRHFVNIQCKLCLKLVTKPIIINKHRNYRLTFNFQIFSYCKTGFFRGQVTTVDKYQGQQNDYIILSLVRTATVGHIRDVRRLVVALSRARLGLYILGRLSLFKNCFELTPAFNIVQKCLYNSMCLL